MKKLTVFLAALLGLLTAVSCGGPTQRDEENPPVNYDTPNFDLERYMSPLWEGEVTVNETVLPLSDRFGEPTELPLLYDATEIISVRNGPLDTSLPANSYELREGKLFVKKTSGVLYAYDRYYLDQPNFSLIHLPSVSQPGKYLMYQEGSYFHSAQLAVTYRHAPADLLTPPAKKGALLPATTAKLASGAPLNLVLYGDSISVGANASSYFEVDADPHTPIWGKLLAQALTARTGSAVAFDNSLSKGGEYGCTYGVDAENLRKLNDLKPDLLVIGFGMNDKDHYSKSQFAAAMQTIVDAVKEENPHCEFILVSSWLANPDVSNSPVGNARIKEYRAAMLEMEGPGIAVADVTSFHEQLLTRKRFMDMTGNNVNHPNDFTTRMYAQVLNECIKEEGTK